MSKILRRPTTAALAAQPGGLPSAKTIAPKNKVTISKLGGSIGLNVFGAKSTENTWKFNGNKKKIRQNWRTYDLPPGQLEPHSVKNLGTMLARAEQRNASRIPDRARAIVAETAPLIALQTRVDELAERLKTAQPDSLLHVTHATLSHQLAAMRATNPAAIAQYQAAQRDIAADTIEPVRASAAQALAAFEAAPGDAPRAAYAKARSALVTASVQQFFDGYRTLNEHVSDQGRAKGMAMMLPVLARQLELPAKYLDGVAALAIAEDKLARAMPPGADLHEDRAALRDALVGRRVRDLTAGRAYELPGKPPLAAEAAQWAADAGRLRSLGGQFAVADQLLGDTTAPLKARVQTMQQSCMDDLVAHYPAMAAMDAPQRAQTVAALGVLAANLRSSAGDSVHKDAPLAPMQLMHIVDMAETVTQGDPQRCIAIYRALAGEQVHDIIGRTVAQLGESGDAAAPSRTDQDLLAIWRMGAHQLPDAVSSLLAANPEHGRGARKTDWRDVQTFFRCSQELERLDADGAGDAAHKGRMAAAMKSLGRELATGAQPATGTPERRDWAMAKSAVWEQATLQHVVRTFEGFQAVTALPATVVKQVQGQFDDKGRGNVQHEARAQFQQVLENFQGAAQAALNRPGAGVAEQGNARMLLALCDHMRNHRGSEKILTTAKRKITGKQGTFNSGRELWSNPLKAKEKEAILAAAGASPAAARAVVPLLRKLEDGHSALELLHEAVKGIGSDAERRENLQKLASLDNLVALAKGGPLQGPEPIRRFLHDAIDRTSLGDRTDTLNAKQFKMAVPIVVPLPPVTLSATFAGAKSSGTIVNVSANNDCVQMTLGRMSERASSSSLGVGLGPEILTDAAAKALKKTGLDVKFPSYSWKKEEKRRTDPAIVLKFSIEPEKGLRDLDEARTQLKKAVDILVDWDPNKPQYQQYGSVFEAMCDQLESPFTIDDEVRQYTSVSNENTLTPAKVALKFNKAKLGHKDKGNNDPLRTGIGASVKLTVGRDVMVSDNQQKARELFDTLKKTVGVDAFFSVNSRHTTAENRQGKKLVGAGVAANLTGSLLANVGGGEFKDKKPVGTDKLKAYKSEYGDYSRDMHNAIEVLLEALPAVSNRVQEVVDKGFREQLAGQFEEPALARLTEWQQEIDALQADIDALQARIGAQPAQYGEIEEEGPAPEALAALAQELADKRGHHQTLTEALAQTSVAQVKAHLVDKELGKMGGEVLMNFVRALMEHKTDRFSVKLESKQQWAHRGIEAAIANAQAAGHDGMANVMRAVNAQVFEGDRDQSVKYLIAAGDFSNKSTQFNWKSPLNFKRREVKGMTEDPIPDTRTSTLQPTADRLVAVRREPVPLSDLQRKIVAESLDEVRRTAAAGQLAGAGEKESN